MPRITRRLTAVKVANLKSRGLYADGDSLYLRITASGTKSWIFRFARDGASHDMGLGPLATVSLARARELAGEARGKVLEGMDPIEARKAGRAAQKLAQLRDGATFRACAKQFIHAHEASWRNAKHRAQWSSTLTTYVYPHTSTHTLATCLLQPSIRH
jgi:hypothetical protein